MRLKGYTGNVATLRGFVAKEKAKKITQEQLDEVIRKYPILSGLLNDYDLIINAINYNYNNGLAEGSVNKLKTIKRIMYGRNNFELLRCKVL